jgi:hypothetical protein
MAFAIATRISLGKTARFPVVLILAVEMENVFLGNVFVRRILKGKIVGSLFVNVIIVGSVCLISSAYVKMGFMGRIVRRVCVRITAVRMVRVIKGSVCVKQDGVRMIVR